MTLVWNLDTYDEYEYSLPPEEAVITAWYQYARKNFNTWEYDYQAGKEKLKYCGRTVNCKQFSAVCKPTS